ncbi:hypothetical protein BDZ85DRAFT_293489 [Elsinoe ampelina]|uniref:Uncharacterized protein n=1 Tax=Elsinoe ampelina TaxID=302913 RepID=A0A6A6GLL1_9PEZI|nr:hypothetical protein BDZ85DRAFT_293489 [Elsinoe ampelina]
MPQLNGMRCHLELTPSNDILPESSITYGDQRVECFVRVPDNDAPFSIHLTTTSFVASGLAAFVFLDGQYQANRNKTGFSPPAQVTNGGEAQQIDMRFRQKEEPIPHEKPPAGSVPHLDPSFAANLGTIEVVVLRCEPSGPLHPKSATDIGSDAVSASTLPVTALPTRGKSEAKGENANKKSNHKKSQAKKVVPKPATVKTATPAPSENGMFGGLGGLFDGAGDDPWANHNNDEDKHSRSKQGSHHNKAQGIWKPDDAEEIKYEDFVKNKNQQKTSAPKSPSLSRAVPHRVPQQSSKTYWKAWNPNSKGYGDPNRHDNGIAAPDVANRFVPRDPYVEPAYEQPEIYSDFARARGLYVQATTYKGARYVHPVARPLYFDTMEAPFVVFTFHYRGKAFFEAAKEKSRSKADSHAFAKLQAASSVKTPSVRKTVANWDDGNQQKAAAIQACAHRSKLSKTPSAVPSKKPTTRSSKADGGAGGEVDDAAREGDEQGGGGGGGWGTEQGGGGGWGDNHGGAENGGGGGWGGSHKNDWNQSKGDAGSGGWKGRKASKQDVAW